VSQVRNHRLYNLNRIVEVPWSDRQLSLHWKHFRDRSSPGAEESWTLQIRGENAAAATAELMATLYDASLDAIFPHQWQNLQLFRQERLSTPRGNNLGEQWAQNTGYWHYPEIPDMLWNYPELRSELTRGWAKQGKHTMMMERGGMTFAMPPPPSALSENVEDLLVYTTSTEVKPDWDRLQFHEIQTPPTQQPDPVQPRRNLNETAFFFPHLQSDDEGMVQLKFTLPDALTRWRFMALAHDRNLRSGFLEATLLSSKDLMVQTNPPRFLREGDLIHFSVKVLNQSDRSQKGTLRLNFSDAVSLKPLDAFLKHRKTKQAFNIPAGQSRAFFWAIKIPEACPTLRFTAMATTPELSDGEQANLPVISKRILVTESLSLPIRDAGEKQFRFEKLIQSAASPELRHESLTFEMLSQPAWHALLSLPYLMEYPYECSEQLFNRYYANALAAHIARSDPKIERVFEQWRNSPALDSPLFKNEDLKSILAEESPWLLDAKEESESRRRIAGHFDRNQTRASQEIALRQLSNRQLSDGLWAWFPGGQPSHYISLYLVAGFGKLQQLGVETDASIALTALPALDQWMQQAYDQIQKQKNADAWAPDHLMALYLYARSFFLEEQPINGDHQEALGFFIDQSIAHWPEINSLQTQAQLALALNRFGAKDTASLILRSLRERSVRDPEMGMHWPNQGSTWWWYHAPIETQAALIEAFHEIENDQSSVQDCQIWLLKQKQTQHWPSTRSTADAVYALLLRGPSLLSSDALVKATLGGVEVETRNAEAGSGYYRQRWEGSEVRPEMGQITLTKTDPGVSWGALHWRYLEDVNRITPHEGSPLKLRKELLVRRQHPDGSRLENIQGPLEVGDELVVRIELRSDRDMEYLHLKDQRGSGTEPVQVLSQYRWQDGLGYYQSTRDSATHFFIDYLPAGTYAFEYPLRIQLKGHYPSGIATIQSLYAPEFNSHSESFPILVE
jgi:uncharacterized protein YfaS (alpha-2-macroglobulin family)